MFIRRGVVIQESHNLTLGRLPADVAGVAQATIGNVNPLDVKFRGDRRAVVRRAVDDDYHLKPGILQALQSLQATAQGGTAIVSADHDRNERPVLARAKRYLLKD